MVKAHVLDRCGAAAVGGGELGPEYLRVGGDLLRAP
jgi:hypothetical protein